MPATAPSEPPSVDISWKDVKDLFTLAPPPPRPYISWTHACGRCGRLFKWPSKSKLFCPDCVRLREKAYWVRTNRKHWAKKKPLPDGVPNKNTCARCGAVIGKRKRFCVQCRRVREMDGDAARKRLKTASSRPPFNSDSMPPEQFAPNMTKD